MEKVNLSTSTTSSYNFAMEVRGDDPETNEIVISASPEDVGSSEIISEDKRSKVISKNDRGVEIAVTKAPEEIELDLIDGSQLTFIETPTTEKTVVKGEIKRFNPTFRNTEDLQKMSNSLLKILMFIQSLRN